MTNDEARMTKGLPRRWVNLGVLLMAFATVAAAVADLVYGARYELLSQHTMEFGERWVPGLWLGGVGIVTAVASLGTPRLIVLTVPAVLAVCAGAVVAVWKLSSPEVIVASIETPSPMTMFPWALGRGLPQILMSWIAGSVVLVRLVGWGIGKWRRTKGAE